MFIVAMTDNDENPASVSETPGRGESRDMSKHTFTAYMPVKVLNDGTREPHWDMRCLLLRQNQKEGDGHANNLKIIYPDKDFASVKVEVSWDEQS